MAAESIAPETGDVVMNSRANENAETGTPSLAELFASYLNKTEVSPADAAAGVVEAYDSGLAHPVDAALAWRGALSCLVGVGGLSEIERPSEWITLVQARDSYPAVAMAAGNYPQMLRDLPGLVQAENLADLRAVPAPDQNLPGPASWAGRTAQVSFAGRMLAAGVLRLAGQFSAAKEFLSDAAGLTKSQNQVLENERATLQWCLGNFDQASSGWHELSQTPFGAFNLGMSALFHKPTEALPHLQSAVGMLADDDPWRHLAGIYLALAEMRS
jgi:hypothetical protein